MDNEVLKSLVSEDKQGRLPNFFCKLRYIVIDEVHLVHEWLVILHGSFSSHLLNFD